MAASNHTPFNGGSNAANRLTPEQKLIRLRAVCKVYKRAIVSREFFLQAASYDLSKSIHLMPWQRRIERCERYIERLTAPAGGAE